MPLCMHTYIMSLYNIQYYLDSLHVFSSFVNCNWHLHCFAYDFILWKYCLFCVLKARRSRCPVQRRATIPDSDNTAVQVVVADKWVSSVPDTGLILRIMNSELCFSDLQLQLLHFLYNLYNYSCQNETSCKTCCTYWGKQSRLESVIYFFWSTNGLIEYSLQHCTFAVPWYVTMYKNIIVLKAKHREALGGWN